MITERLMDYIGEIDNSMIKEAEYEMVKFDSTKRTWIKWVSVGAVATCLVFATPYLLKQKKVIKGIKVNVA